MKKIFIICLVAATLSVGLCARPAYAQTTNNCQTSSGGQLSYCPLEPLPGLDDESGSVQSLGEVINYVFRTTFALAGLFAVVALILGGISYMTSEAFNTKLKARERIKSASLGLAILAFSYLLLNTINPDILTFNFLSSSPSTQNIPPPNSQVNGTPYYCKSYSGTNNAANRQACVDKCVADGGSLVPLANGNDSTGPYTLYNCPR